MDVFANWMDFGLAWVAVLLTVLLAGIFILRKYMKGDSRFAQWLRRANQFLRKHHKVLGVALIAVGFVHGLYSSQSVFSFNLGTVAWVLSILLGINWLIRKPLAKHKGWMVYHRALTALFLAVIVWHVVDVGGIQAPQVLFGVGGGNTVIENRVHAAAAPTTGAADTVDTTSNDSTGTGGSTPAETSTADALAALTDGQFQDAILKDGTYTGTAQGYNPGITVSVTIKDNTITDVQVVSHNEDGARYYSTPISVIPQEIVDAQTTEVDTVTRSTFTSVGIINAVNDALKQALVSGELPADQSLPANRRGRH